MELYERTELEIIRFTTQEIISTSGIEDETRDPYEGGVAG